MNQGSTRLPAHNKNRASRGFGLVLVMMVFGVSCSKAPVVSVSVDIPLSSASKRVLFYAVEEADRLSSKHIGSEHLLLGLLRDENCFAAEFLHEHGVRLASTREELMRIRHNYSAAEQFVREREPLPEDVVELQTRVGIILRRAEDAVAQHDFAKAREYSEEEAREREKLRVLYRQHGLPDWLYD